MSFFFFFKQRTAYEMRISDWSSDVCSSDLPPDDDARLRRAEDQAMPWKQGPSGEARRLVDGAAAINLYDKRGAFVGQRPIRRPRAAVRGQEADAASADERRVGHAGVSPGRSRWSRLRLK